jgi:Mg2+ and Co2+ transporter CorA
VEDWTQQVDHLSRKSILWIDLDRGDRRQLDEVVESLDLSRTSAERLIDGDERPYFGDFGSYLHVAAFAPSRRNGEAQSVKVDCLFSEQ